MAINASLIGTFGAYTSVSDKQTVVQDPINGITRRRIKFAELITMIAAQVTSWGGLVAGDKIALLPIPKGSLVQSVSTAILSADSAAATLDIGDSTTATKWATALALNAAGLATSAASGIYAADDAVIMTTKTVMPTNCVIEVAAQIFELFPSMKANLPLI